MKNKKLVSLLFLIIAIIISMLLIYEEKSYAAELTPTDEQYMELKLVSTEPVEGGGTQAILEWWSYNLDFKGFDVRFSYDSTKLTPSNITTNVATTGTDCFTFENGFDGFLQMFQVSESQTNIIRYAMALNPTVDAEGNVEYASTNSYLQTDEETGDYVTSTDGVLIGRLSFLVTEGAELDDTTFALVTSENSSPLTGVKIAKTAEDYYSNQSVFRFTMIRNGTLSGSIETAATKNTTGKNVATVKVYKSTDVVIDWETVASELDSGALNDNINATLNALTPVYTGVTNDDGTYLIELEEETYVVLIDKPGYLDSIYTDVTINSGENTPLDLVNLTAGDTDKNGVINNNDIVKLYQQNGLISTDENYSSICDFDENDTVNNTDLVITYQNNGMKRTVVKYIKEG